MSDADATEDRDNRWLFWGTCALVFIGLWVWPLRASLWSDELVTAWVTSNGLSTTIGRSFEFQNSPLYFMIAWASRTLLGNNELALRAPSLIAGVVAIFVFRRLLARLVDVETADLGTAFFVGLGIVSFVVTDARPYGIGVLLIVASSLALVRWLDDPPRARWAVLYVACAVAIVWVQFTLGVILLVHAILPRRPSRRPEHVGPKVRGRCGRRGDLGRGGTTRRSDAVAVGSADGPRLQERRRSARCRRLDRAARVPRRNRGGAPDREDARARVVPAAPDRSLDRGPPRRLGGHPAGHPLCRCGRPRLDAPRPQVRRGVRARGRGPRGGR